MDPGSAAHRCALRSIRGTNGVLSLASKPGKAGLYRVVGAVEFAQIGQPAHRQAVHVLFTGLEQRGDILRHLGAGLAIGGGTAVHQEIIGLHDAVDGSFHGFLSAVDPAAYAHTSSDSNCWIALLASLILLHSPRLNIPTTI